MTLHNFTPPIILYAQLKVYKLPLKIKLWALLKAWSPRVLLSLSFSFSGWFPGAQGPSAFTFLPGFLRHTGEGAQSGAPSTIWKGACGLREQSKSRAGALLAFCVNQGISTSFLSSIFLTAKFFPYLFLYFSQSLMLSSRGNPWIQPRLDPGRKHAENDPNQARQLYKWSRSAVSDSL